MVDLLDLNSSVAETILNNTVVLRIGGLNSGDGFDLSNGGFVGQSDDLIGSLFKAAQWIESLAGKSKEARDQDAVCVAWSNCVTNTAIYYADRTNNFSGEISVLRKENSRNYFLPNNGFYNVSSGVGAKKTLLKSGTVNFKTNQFKIVCSLQLRGSSRSDDIINLVLLGLKTLGAKLTQQGSPPNSPRLSQIPSLEKKKSFEEKKSEDFDFT